MNILKKAIGYFIRPVQLADMNYNFVQESSYSGENINASSALALSSVWACVNLISGTISTLPFQLYDNSKPQRRVDSSHPLVYVLKHSPNAYHTAVDFWEYMSICLELWGNAYAKITRNSQGNIISLDPFSPELVRIEQKQGGLEYRWFDGRAQQIATEKEIFHIRGFGGGASPLGGISTLSAGRHVFGIAKSIDKAAGKTFENGLRPSGVLTIEKFLTPEERSAAYEKIVNKFAGATNAGRPLLLEGGIDWKQININPEDAQMLESRAFSVEEICRFFGVPPSMIGHTEKSTSWGTGLEQQLLAFQKFTLRKRLKRIEQAIVKQLLTPIERMNYSAEFNIEGLLRADSGARASYYASMLSNGVMTINEVRALESLEPVSGGDVPRMQMQNVPIGGNTEN